MFGVQSALPAYLLRCWKSELWDQVEQPAWGWNSELFPHSDADSQTFKVRAARVSKAETRWIIIIAC